MYKPMTKYTLQSALLFCDASYGTVVAGVIYIGIPIGNAQFGYNSQGGGAGAQVILTK